MSSTLEAACIAHCAMQAAVVVTLRYIKHVSVRVKARNMVVNEDCWHLLHQEAGEDDVEGNR